MRLSDDAASRAWTASLPACGAHTDGTFNEEQVELALDLVRRAGFEWTDEALDGVGRSARLIGADGARRIFDLDAGSLEAFTVVSRRSAGIWDEATGEALARYFSHSVDTDVVRLPQPLPSYFQDSLTEYPDEVVETTLRFIAKGDPDAATDVLRHVDDPRDLLQWKASGNDLNIIDELNIPLHRQDITEAELQQIWQPMLDRWNGGEPFTGDDAVIRRAEAIGVELPIYRLRQQGYDVVWINTRGHRGPDAILLAPDGVTPVFMEAKGTLRKVSNLTGSMFPEPSLGRQLSREWLLTDAGRYLDQIENDEVAKRVTEMVARVQAGEAYEAVIGRGALNADVLDYGTEMSAYIRDIDPSIANAGWRVRSIFVNRP